MKIKKYLNGKIMDYKEKYNKLVNAIKVLQETNPSDKGIQNWVNDNVPELKESEDERARKRLIAMCQHYIECYSFDQFNLDGYKEALAWLEKQREKKSIEDLTQQEAMDIAVAKCFEQSEQKHALDIEIPFGAKDSELQEATYLIPKGFHAEIKDDEVLIKKGKQKPAWSKEDEWKFSDILALLRGGENCHYNTPDLFDWFKSLKNRIKGG